MSVLDEHFPMKWRATRWGWFNTNQPLDNHGYLGIRGDSDLNLHFPPNLTGLGAFHPQNPGITWLGWSKDPWGTVMLGNLCTYLFTLKFLWIDSTLRGCLVPMEHGSWMKKMLLFPTQKSQISLPNLWQWPIRWSTTLAWQLAEFFGTKMSWPKKSALWIYSRLPGYCFHECKGFLTAVNRSHSDDAQCLYKRRKTSSPWCHVNNPPKRWPVDLVYLLSLGDFITQWYWK